MTHLFSPSDSPPVSFRTSQAVASDHPASIHRNPEAFPRSPFPYPALTPSPRMHPIQIPLSRTHLILMSFSQLHPTLIPSSRSHLILTSFFRSHPILIPSSRTHLILMSFSQLHPTLIPSSRSHLILTSFFRSHPILIPSSRSHLILTSFSQSHPRSLHPSHLYQRARPDRSHSAFHPADLSALTPAAFYPVRSLRFYPRRSRLKHAYLYLLFPGCPSHLWLCLDPALLHSLHKIPQISPLSVYPPALPHLHTTSPA